MKFILLSILVLLFFSCSKSNPKEELIDSINENARTYLTKDIESKGLKIDTLALLRVDTLTSKAEAIIAVEELQYKVKEFQDKADYFLAQAEKWEGTSRGSEMHDSTILQIKKSKELNQQVSHLINKINTIDSTKIIGYSGLFNLKVSDRYTKEATKIDTFRIKFNKDLTITSNANWEAELLKNYK